MSKQRYLLAAAKAVGFVVEKTLPTGSFLVVTPEGARRLWNPYQDPRDVLALIARFSVSFSYSNAPGSGFCVEANSGEYRVVESYQTEEDAVSAMVSATVRIAALYEDVASFSRDLSSLSTKIVALQSRLSGAQLGLEALLSDPKYHGDTRLSDVLRNLEGGDSAVWLLDSERLAICAALEASGQAVSADLVRARLGVPSVLTN